MKHVQKQIKIFSSRALYNPIMASFVSNTMRLKDLEWLTSNELSLQHDF